MDENKYFDFQKVCTVCSSDKLKVVYTELVHTCNVLELSGVKLQNDDVKADVVECKRCGHRFLSKFIKSEYIERYYSVVGSEYYKLVKENPSDRNPKLTAYIVKVLKDIVPKGSSVLEIGCGTGNFLSALKNEGYNCFGVEPSHFISELARNTFKINVVTGMLDFTTFDRKFDLIVINDVIEHVYNPNDLFEKIAFYLNPGGKVLVLTGNSKSLYSRFAGKRWLYFFSWEHINFYNKKSISFLLNRHNCRLIFFKTLMHSGSFKGELKLLYYTFTGKIGNLLKLRRHKFFYMAFDHFIAIGEIKK